MNAWRASIIAALLLLSLLGLCLQAVAESEEAAAPRADSLSPQDGLAGEELVPLTPIAARFGVIVTIRGTHVNVICRDGTRLRLKGVLPGDAPELVEGPPLLLQQGEAWVRPSDLPQLLGLCDTDLGQAGVQTPSSEGGFEAFEVRKPVVRHPSFQPRPAEPDQRHLLTPDAQETDSFLQTDTSPVEVGLGVSRVSTFSDPDMAGVYQEVVGPASTTVAGGPRELDSSSPIDRTLSYLSMDVYDGERFWSLGDIADPFLGPSTGFEVRSFRSDGAWLGAALVSSPDLASDRQEGQLALKAGVTSTDGAGGEVAVSPDGSHLLVGEWRDPSRSVRLSLFDRLDVRRRDLSWSQAVTPSTKVFGRHAQAAGDYDAETQLLGVEWRLGRARLALEQYRGDSAGETWGNDALSLSLMQRRATASLRYLLARAEQDREGLEWFVSRFDSSGRQFHFSSTAPASGPLQAGRTYQVGASLPVRKNLRSRGSMEFGEAGLHPEAKLEWRRSLDQVFSLRYGLLSQEIAGTGTERGLVFQGSIAFGGAALPPRGTGRIVGRVRDDAGRGVADVAVVLEEVAVTFTRADGSFEFRGVATGRQRVKLDEDRLHADLGGAPPPRTVFVQQDGAERADFVVTRVCRVAGQVYIQSSSDGPREPVVGAVVELTGGRRATTNSEGSYSFESLPPGPYTVSFASSTDASTLTPTSPTSWSFRLQPGDQVTEADFAFERRARPVVFDEIAE